MNKQEIIKKLSDRDGFTVGWAGRNDRGDLVLTGDVFKVKTMPPALFYYNAQSFGFDRAMEMAEEAPEPPPHDFGACAVKDKSLRKEDDGKWYLDLKPQSHNCRHFNVRKVLFKTNEAGEFIRDENGSRIAVRGDDGKPVVKVTNKRESVITVELSMIEPMLDHDLSFPYVQPDSWARAKLAMGERSENALNRKERKERKKTQRAARVSREEFAVMLGEFE